MIAEVDEFFVAVSRHAALQRLGMPTTPPVLNDRYELHGVVGSGSFGVVYRAWDRVFERLVALKRTQTGDFGEARALAAIRHPNVVRVFDVLLDGPTVVLVMEYLDGRKLADWLGHTQPSQGEVLGLLAKAADGLAAIHSAGLVHADVKPSNIMVVDHEPVIVDLGLAMTGSGGTPKYMAPEVRHGGLPHAGADQYSFCLLAQEVLGPRPGRRCARAIRRGLSDAREDRWQTMAELAAVLHDCARARRRWWSRWLVALPLAFCPRVASVVEVEPPASFERVGQECAMPHARTRDRVDLRAAACCPEPGPDDGAQSAVG